MQRTSYARAALAGTLVTSLMAGMPMAQAAIDLELRPSPQSAAVGDIVELGLYAVADGADQSFAAVEVILEWSPVDLELLGLDDSGSIGLLSSAFPMPDPYGLNDAAPPMDGDALYVGLAGFGSPTFATSDGVLLTTLRFEALAPTASTAVDIVESGGSPEGQTIVFDGMTPNLDVTGALRGATVEIVASCEPDLDADGTVGSGDLAILLGDWATTGSPADFDGGGVGSSDLATLLGAWGPCP